MMDMFQNTMGGMGHAAGLMQPPKALASPFGMPQAMGIMGRAGQSMGQQPQIPPSFYQASQQKPYPQLSPLAYNPQGQQPQQAGQGISGYFGAR